MTDLISLFNFLTIGLVIAATSMGVAIGGSIAAVATTESINIQPRARTGILKASIVGMALTETAAIIGFVVGILLLTNTQSLVSSGNIYYAIANLGIIFAICIAGFATGYASSYPVRYTCLAIARQPFFANQIFNVMLLTLSFIQTPIIFGFIISLLINFQAAQAINLTDSLRLVASGLCVGLGAVGPTIGLALFSKEACYSLGVNRHSYSNIITFVFLSEALIETPIVFGLVTSLLLLTRSYPNSMLYSIVVILAALCTGISNITPGISSGKIAATACKQISYNQSAYPLVSKASMLAQGMIDSFTIYGWIISLMLILFVK